MWAHTDRQLTSVAVSLISSSICRIWAKQMRKWRVKPLAWRNGQSTNLFSIWTEMAIYKVLSAMGRDDSWLTTVPSVVLTGVCCHWSIYYIHSANRQLRSEWAKCQPRNTQNGRTILPIVNLMADSESRSPVSYSSFLVTICLSCLVSEIFTSDRRMDNVNHY